ncbi:MAG: tetratricopeptide repeat protein [Candidatus Electrothrix sp. GW3-4]|uniref:tetratricopeptide repeat protein n=1 Tax=Candidatus Electrothrix sp. GW3-4 TaxID=3126740 RepID=UPI0030D4C6FE
MSIELRLTFPDASHVMVSLRGNEEGDSPPAEFINPLEEKDLNELRWYLEDYGTSYAAEPDDTRAAAVQERLPVWGTALFEAALEGERKAAKLFDRFLESREKGRVLSIAADEPAVLTLPWELLHTPGGTYLCNENPPISIRRGLPSAGDARTPQPRAAKPNLHLLFIVSRPEGASFIDPRRDADAVLSALAKQEQARVEVEFLRPPTLDALRRRLRDTRLPSVDIIHFDGHGVFGKDSEADRGGKGDDIKGDGAATDRQQGWLLFEDKEGGKDRVAAEKFGSLLHQNHAGLVVLSACQSAAMDSKDPMSGCAARLVHAGIPAVIAMTHSVLVSTAEQLFAEFYASLFEGRTVARSLDEARHALLFNPERGICLRGAGLAEEFRLDLYDWFLPALYQSGADMALLSAEVGESPEPCPALLSNLPEPQQSGFFGRSRELWQIERAFGVEDCRRFSITGFGGQGKTALALEAGRWLLRTGLFQRVCMISYAAYQGSDPVSMAIATMSTVFEESLIDVDAAQTSLAQTPTLLILDNLESLAADNTLAELLDAALPWSEAGASRVLLTSRQPDCNHPGYPLAGDYRHQTLALQGLQAHDSVDWFDSLRRLPPRTRLKRPRRDVLINLFRKVGFHPLSISLLAQQLKERGPAEVEERLEALLEEQPVNQADRSLLASLELSLERLPAQCREWLPRLGVFQGGCLEEMIGRVTGLAEADEDPGIAEARKIWEALESGDPAAMIRAAGLDLPEGELPPEIVQQLQEMVNDEEMQQLGKIVEAAPKTELVAGADPSTWPQLREALLRAGLMEALRVPETDKTFLRFHPTLAPALWQRLAKEEQDKLLESYWQAYYQLSRELYKMDRTNPHAARAIVRCELPNLLRAVHTALQTDMAEEGVDFAERVNKFLYFFGLRRDAEELTEAAGKAGGTVGSQAWFLAQSNLGEQLLGNGQPGAAAQVFADILAGLEQTPSGNRCRTLHRLGRCCASQGQPAQAEQLYRQELKELAQLEQSDGVQRQTGLAWTDLADVLVAQGEYSKAKEAYQAGLEIAEEQGDKRQTGVVLGQLGTLAKEQDELAEAEERYKEALTLFQRINEPASEAVFWHQLGLVYQQAKHWEAAEQAYRQAARLKEEQGLLAGNNAAGGSWGQLALLCKATGRLAEAEQWYSKALTVFQSAEDWPNVSRTLSNLADLLANDPARLDEARGYAEEGLAISETLDPAVMQIWNTYKPLAHIADQQGESSQAAEYQAKGRQAYLAFPGWRQGLYQYEELIVAVVQAIEDPDVRKELEQGLNEIAEGPKANLVAAIQRILNGERDEATLSEPLDYTDAAIVHAILEGIEGDA